MYLLECDCLPWHVHLGGSNPRRKLSLLCFAHPVEGSLFHVQGVYRRRTLTRGRVLEESQVMAFVFVL